MEWTQCHDLELNFPGGVGGESAHPLHPSFAFFFCLCPNFSNFNKYCRQIGHAHTPPTSPKSDPATATDTVATASRST